VAVELGAFWLGPHVRVDDEGGAALAADHLLAQGHRDLAVLALEFAADGLEGTVD
jgi:DNA-binding LacI/PurR family transcriptional regulator